MLCIKREVDTMKPDAKESQLYDFSHIKEDIVKGSIFGYGGDSTTQGKSQTPEETKGAAGEENDTTMGNVTMD